MAPSLLFHHSCAFWPYMSYSGRQKAPFESFRLEGKNQPKVSDLCNWTLTVSIVRDSFFRKLIPIVIIFHCYNRPLTKHDIKG